MNLQLNLKVNNTKFENHILYNMYKYIKDIKCYGFNLSGDVFLLFSFSCCADLPSGFKLMLWTPCCPGGWGGGTPDFN